METNNDDEELMLEVASSMIYEELIQSVCIDTAAKLHRWIKEGGTGAYDGNVVMTHAQLCVPGTRRDAYPELYDNKNIPEEKEEERQQREQERRQLENSFDEFAVDVPGRKRSRTCMLHNNDYYDPDLPAKVAILTRRSPKSQDDASSEDYKTTTTTAGGDATTAASAAAAATASSSAQSTPASTITTRQQQQDVWGRIPPKEPIELVRCTICGRQVNALRFAPHLDKCMGIGNTTRAAAAASQTRNSAGSLK